MILLKFRNQAQQIWTCIKVNKFPYFLLTEKEAIQ